MLKRRISLILAVVVIAVLVIVATASAEPGVTSEDLKYIMPLSQVKAGMKGYGLTVFKGTNIEKFDVEVIGLLRKANNGKDLILVRLSGGPVTERGANIMQGMSGSPVYVNGKIIGAVAYGPASFAKEPIGMLTPIEHMLESLDPNLPERPSGMSSKVASLDTPVKIGDDTVSKVEIRRFGASGTAPKGTFVMTPLMTPLMVSGVSNRNMGKLAEILEPFGLVPMAGPGAKADPVDVDLVPGSAIGVSLVTGDIDMTGVGTVTYRRGSKLVAFGHPMMEIGPIDAPMSTAYVLESFPSYNVSFKLASPMKVVGRIFQDRPWSVGGEIGVKPQMIPVTIDVDDKAIGRKKTLHVNIINHPLLVPELLMHVAGTAITEVHGIPGDATAYVDLVVEADQVGKIERKNVFFNPASIEAAAIDDLRRIIGILTSNKFQPLDVKSVHMSVQIESGRKTASIERIFIDKSRYEPGEMVNVGIELRPYKSQPFIKTMQIQVPENAPDGKLTLRVAGGMVGGGEAPVMISPNPDGDGAAITPMPGGIADNINQMISKFVEQEKNNELIVRLLLPTGAISISGEKLTNLPDPIANVIKSPRSTGLKMERDEVKVVEQVDYILTGAQSLPITVARQRKLEKRQQQGDKSGQEAPRPMPEPMVEAEAALLVDDTADIAASVPFGFFDDASFVQMTRIPTPAPEGAGPSEAKPAEQAKQEQKPEEKKADEKKEAEKPVIRQPNIWTQKSLQDFGPGSFSSTAATNADDVRLAPAFTKLSDVPEEIVWTVLPIGGGDALVGTGNNGIVYRVTREGACSSFFSTGELEVHSLVQDSKGNIYAGTSPNGKVYKISPDGQGELVFDAPEKYVLALTVDSSDNVYAGVGDAGKIYRITSTGESTTFVELPNPSVMALTVDGAGNVYAGTGKGGVIFKISPAGAITPLYNAPEDSITSVAVDKNGNVFAGTGVGKGNIYEIPVSGVPKPILDRAPRALSMAIDRENNVYVVSDEQIFKILPDDTAMVLDTDRAAVQFTAIAISQDGTLLAGAANRGALFIAPPVTEGTFESTIHDAGVPSRWGKINWIADVPQGSTISFQTRTGNVAEPDETWSPWSYSYSTSAGQNVASPAGRYIQYKCTLNGANGASPVLKQVSVAYLTENRAPKVTINEPQPGTIIARNYEVKWNGTDPDKDALSYDLYYSADSGKNWQALGSGLKQPKNEEEQAPPQPQEPPQGPPPEGGFNIEIRSDGPPNPEEILAQLKAELDRHPEIPQEIKDKMLAEAPAALAQAIAQAQAGPPPDQEQQPQPAQEDNGEKNTTKQTTYNWDTTKIPDGIYMIKVVASDRVSNAVGYLTDEKIIGPIIVSNTPPRVAAFRRELKVNADKTVSVNGYAYHNSVPIIGVQYKVDDGEWMAAIPADGLFDSLSEPFTVATTVLPAGKHTITVKAIDAAGNSAEAKVDAEIKEQKPEEQPEQNAE